MGKKLAHGISINIYTKFQIQLMAGNVYKRIPGLPLTVKEYMNFAWFLLLNILAFFWGYLSDRFFHTVCSKSLGLDQIDLRTKFYYPIGRRTSTRPVVPKLCTDMGTIIQTLIVLSESGLWCSYVCRYCCVLKWIFINISLTSSTSTDQWQEQSSRYGE